MLDPGSGRQRCKVQGGPGGGMNMHRSRRGRRVLDWRNYLCCSREPMEKAMAPHPSTLAWKIPWMEEPSRLQSMESTKSQTRLSNFTFPFHFHALEKEMATHSNVLAWRIPGMAEPGGLSSMGSHRVEHNWSDLAAAAAENPSGTEGGSGVFTTSVVGQELLLLINLC